MNLKTTVLILFMATLFIGGVSGEKLIAGTEESPAEDILVEFDKAPEPVDGFQSLLENVKYPEAAKKNGVDGIVFVSVIIGADGSVSGLEIAEGVRKDLDQAAMEAIKQTNWLPAQKNGQPVISKIVIPVQFKLKPKK
jgi:TonB family protein